MKSNLDSQTPSNTPSLNLNQGNTNINENISVDSKINIDYYNKIYSRGRELLKRETLENKNLELVDTLNELLSTIDQTIDPEEQQFAFEVLAEILDDQATEANKDNPPPSAPSMPRPAAQPLQEESPSLSLLRLVGNPVSGQALGILESLFSKNTNKSQPSRPQPPKPQPQNTKQTSGNDDLINDLIRLSQSSKNPTERASASQLLAELGSQSSKDSAPQTQSASKSTNTVSGTAYLQEDIDAHKNFIKDVLNRKIKECGGGGNCLILSILCQTLGEELFNNLPPNEKFTLAVDLRQQLADTLQDKFWEDLSKSSQNKFNPEDLERVIGELTSVDPKTQSGHYLAAGDIAEVVARVYNRPFVELDTTSAPGIATITYPDGRIEPGVDLTVFQLPQNAIVVLRSGAGGNGHYRAVD